MYEEGERSRRSGQPRSPHQPTLTDSCGSTFCPPGGGAGGGGSVVVVVVVGGGGECGNGEFRAVGEVVVVVVGAINAAITANTARNTEILCNVNKK